MSHIEKVHMHRPFRSQEDFEEGAGNLDWDTGTGRDRDKGRGR